MESPEPIPGFDQFDLTPPVLQAIGEQGYEAPTPIQSRCIPLLLEGRDLLGQAQTGTGKTAAFALPLISRIDPSVQAPQILVLTPTRELALQVSEAFQSYAHHIRGFHVLPLYGGQSYSLQLRQLRRGVQVVVGTPGRIMDHMRRGTLNLEGIRTLVLDEADEMLNMGFAEDIEWIFNQAPAQRQVALFSATMPNAIRKVAKRHLTDPVEIKVESRTETVDTIQQEHCVVTRFHKLDVLTRVLEIEAFDAMLIFVRTKNATVELAEKLVAHGFAAEALNGDMNQAMRERAVERLKSGKLDILVATDVAARGLDVERISIVVNYDIPNDPESYVHRIGRTGRAGRKGRALMLVQPRERHLLRAIERSIRQQIPALEPPSADKLTEHRIDRFTSNLRQTLTEQDLDFFYRLVERIAREQEMEMQDIAAALSYLSQKERPLEVREQPKKSKHRSERPEQSDRPNRTDRPDRPPRKDRPARGQTRDEPRGRGGDSVPMVNYRIDVGHSDGVKPGEILGAIANEAGLEGRYIGRIDIQDDHAVVGLPEGMPREIQQHLRKVRVRGKTLNLRELAGAGDASGRVRKPHRGKRPEPGKPKK